MEVFHRTGHPYDDVASLLQGIARIQLVQQHVQEKNLQAQMSQKEYLILKEQERNLFIRSQEMAEKSRLRQLQREAEVDSGTESDKECRATPAYALTPVFAYEHTDMADLASSLKTHRESQVTCPSYPIYTQDRRPVRDRAPPVTMLNSLPWQLNTGTTMSCCSDASIPQHLTSLNSASSSSSSENASITARLTERMLSLDSCIDCDGYDSEDELSGINCPVDTTHMENITDTDFDEETTDITEQIADDDEVTMNYVINHSQKSLCKQDIVGCHGGVCNWQRGSFVDEGFQDDDSSPLPVKFSSSPPQGLQRSRTDLSPSMFWACALDVQSVEKASQWTTS